MTQPLTWSDEAKALLREWDIRPAYLVPAAVGAQGFRVIGTFILVPWPSGFPVHAILRHAGVES